MKRIIICMDGTWQSLSQDKLTNIGIVARSVAHKETIRDGAGNAIDYIHQIVIYSHGVGANISALARGGMWASILRFLNRTLGGAFGEGLEDIIVETYLRLCFNYEDGDEIYIFGFSRGAFAARRLAGVINTSGIVSRRHADKAWKAYRLYHGAPGRHATQQQLQAHEAAALKFRQDFGKGGRQADGTRTVINQPPPITYLGVFDTVIQRGFWGILQSLTPAGRRKYTFRNLLMCGNVRAARHAMAVDEPRFGFPLTGWTGLEDANTRANERLDAKPGCTYFQQRWFVGTHGDVGGGDGSKLAAAALKWITDGATEQGLRFYGVHGQDKSPMHEAYEEAGEIYDAPITWPPLWKAILFPLNWPVRFRRVWQQRTPPTPPDVDLYLDGTVTRRLDAEALKPRYSPRQLHAFRKALRERRKEADRQHR